MPFIKSLAIGVLAVMAAAMSYIAAAEMVFEESNPSLAMQLPIPAGFARSQVAGALVEKSVRQGSLLQLDWPQSRMERVHDLSLRAFALEPLDSVALANLALVADSKADGERARLLMLDAEKLTRRNLVANVWLMSDYSKRRDIEAALATLDDALRSSGDARPGLIRSLIANLNYPELLTPMAQLLRADPPWADDFWYEAYKVPAVLHNVAQLRVMVGETGVTVRDVFDQRLLKALVQNELYPDAEKVLGAIAPDRRTDGEILRNNSFSYVPRYAPFDWQLFFDDSLTADIAPSTGQLVIHAYNGGKGAAARQLVGLSPGKYLIAINVDDSDSENAGALSATLSCAQDAVLPTMQIFRQDSNERVRTFSISGGNCQYFWMNLGVQPRDDGQTSTIVLNSISLKMIPDHG
jgi:hypothetical protein